MVLWFSRQKRYGFLRFASGKEDVFVHEDDVTPGIVLQKGDHVEFDLEVVLGKFRAKNVVRIGGA